MAGSFIKKNSIMILILIISFVVTVISSSVAFYNFYQEGSTKNTLHTSGLNIVFDESNSLSISNDNAYPVTDEVGRNSTPYTFTLSSSNSYDVQYAISVYNDNKAIKSDGCGDNLLDFSKIKVQLKKDNEVIIDGLLSNYKDGIIDSGVITKSEAFSYELRLWIDSEAGNEIMGQHFHGKIGLKVTNIPR